jgi:hypothetical protein
MYCVCATCRVNFIHLDVFTLKQLDWKEGFNLFHGNWHFRYWISFSITKKIFRQMYLYTVLVQGKYHLHRPNSRHLHFYKSALCTSMKVSNSLPLSLTSVRNKKLKFKVALRRYLCAHLFCFCSWIFEVKNNWYIFIVVWVLIIPYILYILYVCYSISYCHYGKCLDSWYVDIYVCMFEGRLVIFSRMLCHPFLEILSSALH